jgi:N-acetylmuramoyl-L-alanine amidase
VTEALTHPSPHHNARTGLIRVIVMHATAGKSDAGDLAWMQDPVSKVSYHVVIGRQGQVYRLVPESRRAWHAGKGQWDGHADVNGCSLGLAFSNRHDGTEPLTPFQVASARDVVEGWRAKYPGIRAVVTHGDVALPKGRKDDPSRSPGFNLADYTALCRACPGGRCSRPCSSAPRSGGRVRPSGARWRPG